MDPLPRFAQSRMTHSRLFRTQYSKENCFFIGIFGI